MHAGALNLPALWKVAPVACAPAHGESPKGKNPGVENFDLAVDLLARMDFLRIFFGRVFLVENFFPENILPGPRRPGPARPGMARPLRSVVVLTGPVQKWPKLVRKGRKCTPEH